MNSLDKLYKELEIIERLLSLSKSFGKVNLNNKMVSEQELKEMRDDIKSQIAVEISQRQPKLIK